MSGIIGSKLNIRGSGLVGSLGTDGQHLLSSGAGVTNVFETAASAGFTQSSAIATTSGSYHDFTSIPSGTKIIYLLLNDVSVDHADDDLLIQIGDSGGIEDSLYNEFNGRMTAAGFNSWAKQRVGFFIKTSAVAYGVSGLCTMVRGDVAGLIWHFSFMGCNNLTAPIEDGTTAYFTISTGSKTLSAELDRVRIDTDASGTFNRGSATILYM